MNEIIIYYITIIILAFFTGLIVKTADYLEDTKKEKNKLILITIGIIYGLLIFLMAYYFPTIAPIWLGTVYGLILFGKIDKLAHRIATTITFVLMLLFFTEAISFLLVLFIIINILEELMNDYFDKHKLKNKKLQNFAVSRPLLEISAFIISIILLQFEIFIAILFFDIAYLIITNYENKTIKKKSNEKRRK